MTRKTIRLYKTYYTFFFNISDIVIKKIRKKKEYLHMCK